LTNTITGTNGSDPLTGTSGDDDIRGLDGNDTINPGEGFDLVNGGAGLDLLILNFINNPGVAPSFLNQVSGAGEYVATGKRVTFSNIERFNITGSASDDVFSGFAGNDTINGGDGADTISGGAGINVLNGGLGLDILVDANLATATANLTVKEDGTTAITLPSGASIAGFERFANLTTGSGNDTISFTADFNNTINTGIGNDTINPGLGFDVVNGGDGTDLLIANFSASTLGVAYGFFNLTNGSGNIVASSRKIDYANIERFNFSGSGFDDNLLGGSGNDTINGGGGADTIQGNGGIDILNGNGGVDILIDANLSSATANLTVKEDGTTAITLPSGASIAGFERFTNLTTGSGNDTISFTADFNNTINTGVGNDTINPGLGFDVVNGGTGTDLLTANFSASTLGVSYGFFNLTNGSGTIVASSRQIDYGNIERVNLTGSGLSDNLLGVSGNDSLNGGSGDDTLNGSKGADTLTGGLGSDFFEFNASNEGIDVITDFNPAADTVRLKASGFAGLNVGNLPATAFVLGSGAADAGDRIIYNSTTGAIFFDTDGTGATAQVQIATLNPKPGTNPTAADFVVI
jgi:Ca2+-binding RTX toxin-like protein